MKWMNDGMYQTSECNCSATWSPDPCHPVRQVRIPLMPPLADPRVMRVNDETTSTIYQTCDKYDTDSYWRDREPHRKCARLDRSPHHVRNT